VDFNPCDYCETLERFKLIPILLTLQQVVEIFNVDNLIKVVMDFVLVYGDLFKVQLIFNFCFCTNSVMTF
jgi:hypothetical protein